MTLLSILDLPRLLEPLLIAALRITTAVMITPLFSSTLFPPLLRNTVVVALALAVYPAVASNMPSPSSSPADWVVLIGKEVLLGALIGLPIALLIQAFESVGALVDIQTGLSNATLYDPFGGHPDGPMSSFMIRLAVAFFVVTGGLQVLATLLFESFRLWPVSSFLPTIDWRLRDFAIEDTGDLTRLLVKLATPVVLVLALIDIGFGLVNRVVPQLNVFFFTMPIKGVVSALMIALFLPFVADLVRDEVGRLAGLIDRIARVVAPLF